MSDDLMKEIDFFGFFGFFDSRMLAANPECGTITPLIERTANRILEALQEGSFHPEDPLPSRREWAKRLSVSHSTVSKTMEVLRKRGLVESREGSYTFLTRPQSKPSPAISVPGAKTAEISLWFNVANNVRQIRRGIVRRRFQNQFSASAAGVEFRNSEFGLDFGDFRSKLYRAFLRERTPTLGEFPQTYLEGLNSHDALGEMDTPLGAQYLDLVEDRYLEHSFHNDRLVYLPFACSFSFLACNRELLSQAGIAPDKDFSSWEDFADACSRLKAVHGVEPLQVSEYGLFWLLSQWIYQADSTLPASGRLPLIDWDSDAARVGMDFLFEMVVERKVVRVLQGDKLARTSPFLAGQVPIVMDDILLPSALELGQTDMVTLKPFPPGPKGTQLSLMNTVGWAANAQADPMTRQRASEYAFSWETWIHTGGGGDALRRMGVAPALISLFKEPQKDRSASEKLPRSWARTFAQLKEYGRWEASDSDLVTQILAPILHQAVVSGAADARTLLKHFLLAQYSEGIVHEKREISPSSQTQKHP